MIVLTCRYSWEGRDIYVMHCFSWGHYTLPPLSHLLYSSPKFTLTLFLPHAHPHTLTFTTTIFLSRPSLPLGPTHATSNLTLLQSRRNTSSGCDGSTSEEKSGTDGCGRKDKTRGLGCVIRSTVGRSSRWFDTDNGHDCVIFCLIFDCWVFYLTVCGYNVWVGLYMIVKSIKLWSFIYLSVHLFFFIFTPGTFDGVPGYVITRIDEVRRWKLSINCVWLHRSHHCQKYSFIRLNIYLYTYLCFRLLIHLFIHLIIHSTLI